MRRKAQVPPRPKQPTSPELRDQLLDFLRRKFYEGHNVAFAKDRPRLLQWVVLWPARWLDQRGVTIPADRYRDLFMSVFMDGLRFGNTDNITYLPAWLAKVIQSHFAHHGDEIYDEAKSIRLLIENACAFAKRQIGQAPDPIREMAAAAQLLKANKKPIKTALTPQLEFFQNPTK